jgi:hypothetical protein
MREGISTYQANLLRPESILAPEEIEVLKSSLTRARRAVIEQCRLLGVEVEDKIPNVEDMLRVDTEPNADPGVVASTLNTDTNEFKYTDLALAHSVFENARVIEDPVSRRIYLETLLTSTIAHEMLHLVSVVMTSVRHEHDGTSFKDFVNRCLLLVVRRKAAATHSVIRSGYGQRVSAIREVDGVKEVAYKHKLVFANEMGVDTITADLMHKVSKQIVDDVTEQHLADKGRLAVRNSKADKMNRLYANLTLNSLGVGYQLEKRILELITVRMADYAQEHEPTVSGSVKKSERYKELRAQMRTEILRGCLLSDYSRLAQLDAVYGPGTFRLFAQLPSHETDTKKYPGGEQALARDVVEAFNASINADKRMKAQEKLRKNLEGLETE